MNHVPEEVNERRLIVVLEELEPFLQKHIFSFLDLRVVSRREGIDCIEDGRSQRINVALLGAFNVDGSPSGHFIHFVRNQKRDIFPLFIPGEQVDVFAIGRTQTPLLQGVEIEGFLGDVQMGNVEVTQGNEGFGDVGNHHEQRDLRDDRSHLQIRLDELFEGKVVEGKVELEGVGFSKQSAV